MAFGYTMPSVQGSPAPLELQEVFYEWSPNVDEYLFCQMFPGREYKTPSINFDLAGSPEGALNDGFLDSTPAPQPGRKRRIISLTPLYKDRLEELHPSDAVNQRALGALDEIDPEQAATLVAEECAIATWTQRELDTIAALSGSLTPSLFGGSGAPYSYGVQTWNPTSSAGGGGYLWSNLTQANPIADIIGMALLLRGEGYEPHLFYNARVGGYLAQNAAIVNLAKQSGFADMIGPGGAVGQIMSNQGVASLLKSFTGIEGATCYDQGYKTLNRTTGAYTFLPFIADTQCLMIGKAPRNQTRGWFGFAPTPNKGGLMTPQAGPWLRQFDQSSIKPNGGLQIYAGYYGIPALPFPKLIINGTVA